MKENCAIILLMRILKTFFFVFLFLFVIPPSLAIEEVVLDINGEVEYETVKPEEDVITDDEWYFDMGGKTLSEKIQEIKAKEVNDIGKSHYLLKEILTKKFDNSPIKTIHCISIIGIKIYTCICSIISK